MHRKRAVKSYSVSLTILGTGIHTDKGMSVIGGCRIKRCGGKIERYVYGVVFLLTRRQATKEV